MLNILVISAFGPYVFLSFGLRLEHVVIYSLFLIFVITNQIRIKNNVFFLLPILTLLFLFLTPLFGFISSDYSNGSAFALSQIENYFQPFAIVIICFSIISNLNYEELESLLAMILKIILIMMVFNTIISFLMYIYPTLTYWRVFTGADLIVTDDPLKLGYTASELARTAGRISGVFTQVFEAGYAYSLAIISWAYLYSKYRDFLIFQNGILLILLFGGFLVSSKVFIVFGLGLFVYCFNRKIVLFLWSLFAFIIATFVFLIQIDVSFFAKSFKYAGRLLNVNFDTVFAIFTSNRFDSDSAILTNMKGVLLSNPFFGKGFGSIQNSDFSLYEILYIGGIVGTFFYLSLLLILLWFVFFIKDILVKRFYFSIILLTIVTSLAAPTITANRISLLFWVVMSIFIVMVFCNSKLKIRL